MKYYNRYYVIVFLFVCFVNCSYEKQQNFNKQGVVKKATKGLLVCDTTHFNYNKIEKGVIIEKNFLLVNVGDETVNITNVEFSCGCTSLDIPSKVVHPKDSVSIKMKIDTNDKETGLHSINAILTTNGERETYILLVDFEI